MDMRSDRSRVIENALGAITPDLVCFACNDWRLFASNGAKIGVRARLVDDWLGLTASTADPSPIAPAVAWPMLQFNAGIYGPTRLALSPGACATQLRADLFIEDDADLTHLEVRVGRAFADLQSRFHDFHKTEDSGERECPPPPAFAPAPPDATRLVHLCTDAGWPCAERVSGHVTVAIDAGSAQYQARIESARNGGLRAVVDLIDSSAYTPASRAATGLLLLAASAVVRSVKGVVVANDDTRNAGVAAEIEALSGTAVDRALSALTVACRLVGREAQALRDESLARQYLAYHTPELFDRSTDATSTTHNEMEESPCLQLP